MGVASCEVLTIIQKTVSVKERTSPQRADTRSSTPLNIAPAPTEYVRIFVNEAIIFMKRAILLQDEYMF
jgi:hypothetical protein